MWRQSPTNTFVHFAHCRGLHQLLTPPRRKFLRTRIRQHWLGCRYDNGSNRIADHSLSFYRPAVGNVVTGLSAVCAKDTWSTIPGQWPMPVVPPSRSTGASTGYFGLFLPVELYLCCLWLIFLLALLVVLLPILQHYIYHKFDEFPLMSFPHHDNVSFFT